MESKIEELFSALNVEFDTRNIPLPIAEIICFGKIHFLPELIANIGAEQGQYVWSTGPGWIDFSRSELEAWLVDVPEGNHLLIIEREFDVDISYRCPNGVEIELWGREKLALLIGYSVLEGTNDTKLILNNDSDIDVQVIEHNEEKSETTYSKIQKSKLVCIKSEINPLETLELQGISQAPCQPILLEVCFWLIDGFLNGPDNSKEERKWVVLEDNFSDKFSLQEDLSYISKIPNVPILSILGKNNDEKLRKNLDKLCDERRHESISTSELNSGKLLRWWRHDKKSIECTPQRGFIPSWLFISPLEGKKIIHGLSGKMLDFKGELKGIP